MSYLLNYDNKIKSRIEADAQISTDVLSYPVTPVKSAFAKNQQYNFISTYQSHLGENVQSIDISTYNSLNGNLFSAGNTAYQDFKLQSNLKNALQKYYVTIYAIKNNHATLTASLSAAPLHWYQQKLLRGGQDCLQSYCQAATDYVETCMTIQETNNSSINAAAYANYGIDPSTFQSNLTIAPGATRVIFSPVQLLKNTYIPLESLAKQEMVIRIFPQNNILYAASGNVALSDLSLVSMTLRCVYVEVKNYEYSQLMSYKVLHVKSWVRHVEALTVQSTTAGVLQKLQLQSTRGTWGTAMFVYLAQQNLANTNVDTFIPLSNLWIENSSQQNIFNNIQLTPQWMQYIGDRLSGGCAFLSSGINVNLLTFSNTNPQDDLEYTRQSGSYVFTQDDLHYVCFIPSTNASNLTLYVITYLYGCIALDNQTGMITETSS